MPYIKPLPKPMDWLHIRQMQDETRFVIVRTDTGFSVLIVNPDDRIEHFQDTNIEDSARMFIEHLAYMHQAARN